jgi:hypothetical protein
MPKNKDCFTVHAKIAQVFLHSYAAKFLNLFKLAEVPISLYLSLQSLQSFIL